MAPRFVNPHTLADNSVIVSRDDLALEGNGDESGSDSEITALLQSLYQVVDTELRKRGSKRQKLDVASYVETGDVDIPFRLVSRSLPAQVVILDPKPPPEVRSIPPEWEDNAVDAAIRAERARIVAVEGEDILRQAKIHTTPKETVLPSLKGPLPSPSPTILLALAPQSPRTTRPPIPACHSGSTPCVFPQPTPAAKYPIVEVQAQAPNLTPTQRRKVRRSKLAQRAKSEGIANGRPAVFWSPDLRWRGKCLGYAQGYPSSLHTHDFSRKTYRRDTMKKGIVEDFR